jgi:ribosomal protein S18 acetylase RimI-like enzyme
MMAAGNSTKNQEFNDKSITIREAEPVDVEAVGALDARITGLSKPDYWRKAYTRYGTRPDRFFLVAERDSPDREDSDRDGPDRDGPNRDVPDRDGPDRDGQVIGFIIGEVRAWEFGSPPCGWVFALGVDPANREGGIGSQLFAALIARMKASGVSTVRTMLARDDALNMAFFRSQGMMGGSFIQLEMPLDGDGE